MLTSEHWIPVEGVHEVPLVQALIEQRRRLVKPLQYDARTIAAFANALLLDVGPSPAALHLLSAFMAPKERSAKVQSIAGAGPGAWVWSSDQPMPLLPPVAGKSET